MARLVSRRYLDITAQCEAFLGRNPTFSRKMRSRVGLPRYTACEAAFEASLLLLSVNRQLFRRDPEIDQLLKDAREATEKLWKAMDARKWELYEGQR